MIMHMKKTLRVEMIALRRGRLDHGLGHLGSKGGPSRSLKRPHTFSEHIRGNPFSIAKSRAF
jgi:hypothetical protein